MRRVAITGIGVISALGNGRDSFFDGLRDGRCGIGPVGSVDTTGLKITTAAEVRGFDPLNWFDPKAALQLDRSVLFAGAAAAEAMADSALAIDPARTAVVTGCSIGGKSSEDEVYRFGQLDLDALRGHRPHLHGIDGLRFWRPRHRAGLLDGTFGPRRCGDCWWH